jgi:hypothetical protein
MTRLDGRGLAGMVKMVTLYAGKSRVWTHEPPSVRLRPIELAPNLNWRFNNLWYSNILSPLLVPSVGQK